MKLCLICRQSRVITLLDVPGYEYCLECKLAWMKNFPKTEYEEEYYVAKSGIAAQVFNPIAKLLYKIRESYLKKEKYNVWMDVGAGEGGFLTSINARKKVGVEVSKAGREMMKKSGIQAISETEYLKVRSMNANVISFWHVLEHLEKPWEYLRVAKKNLSKNGVVIIGVPNIESWEFKFFKQYWFHLAPKYHLWHFSPSSMTQMLRNEGFKVEEINYWSPEHTIAGLLQSFINKTSGTDAVLHKLVKRQLGDGKLPVKGIIWSLFWLTIGLPIIILAWIYGVISKTAGTFVIIASAE